MVVEVETALVGRRLTVPPKPALGHVRCQLATELLITFAIVIGRQYYDAATNPRR